MRPIIYNGSFDDCAMYQSSHIRQTLENLECCLSQADTARIHIPATIKIKAYVRMLKHWGLFGGQILPQCYLNTDNTTCNKEDITHDNRNTIHFCKNTTNNKQIP